MWMSGIEGFIPFFSQFHSISRRLCWAAECRLREQGGLRPLSVGVRFSLRRNLSRVVPGNWKCLALLSGNLRNSVLYGNPSCDLSLGLRHLGFAHRKIPC